MITRDFRQLSGKVLLSGIGIAVVVISSLVFLRLGGSSQNVTAGPRLVLGPDPASPGSLVTISGFDFPASQAVKVYFQDPSQGVVNTTTNPGGFFNTGLKLPNHINDAFHVYAVSGSVICSVLIDVIKPSLTALKTPSAQNGAALINGKGFLPNAPVTLILDNGSSRMHMGTVMTNPLGQISSSVAVPAMSSDEQDTLVATDPARNTAIANLSTAPRIFVAPSAGQRGSHVTLNGSGFVRGETVTISFGGQQVATVRSVFGHFTVRFTVPLNAVGGANTLTATGSSSGSVSTTFRVISALLYVPHRGFPGQSIAAIGGSFSLGKGVSIELVNASTNRCSVNVPMGATTADNTGQIHTFLTVPHVPPGLYDIVFVDQATGNTTTVPFRVT